MEGEDEQKIQHDVQRCGQNQEIEGPLGVAHRPEDPCAHVVEHEPEDAGEVDGKIGPGLGEHLRRGLHEPKHQRRHAHADGREQHAQNGGHDQGRIDRVADLFLLLGSVILGDDHARAGGQAHEEADEHVKDRGHGAHGGEGLLPYVVAHHPGVHGVI